MEGIRPIYQVNLKRGITMIELSKGVQEKVEAAKSQINNPVTETSKVETVKATKSKPKTSKPKTKNTKGQNKKSTTTFEFMACSSGKIPGCNLVVSGKVKSFVPGKRYDIDLLTLDKLPKQIARSLAPMFKQFQKKFPLCIGHNYGGLQVGLNQNESTTWGNVLSYQDNTVFFTSSRVLPFGGVDTIKAKMSKHATPANRSGGTWAGWSIKKGVPDTKPMQVAIKAILG